MKIFLTGGSGMVGKNILEHPKSQMYKIFSPKKEELNLLNRTDILNYLFELKPEFVIHCAGKVGGIEANMSGSLAFLRDNVEIGLNVIEASSQAGVKNLINLGSSCMYPKMAPNPLKEKEILRGELEPTNEGYALAKIVTAKLCEYIVKEDPSKKYVTIIPCNLYGRHDNFDINSSHLIPGVISKLHNAVKKGKTCVDIWGDGNARREFMFSEDLADLIFFAIENFESIPQNLNAGLGHDFSINEYYKTIASVIGYSGRFEHDLSKPVGMHQKVVDITKLKKLGWSHKTNLIDGIRQAYEFYKGEN